MLNTNRFPHQFQIKAAAPAMSIKSAISKFIDMRFAQLL
jgi:hypothetical protein